LRNKNIALQIDDDDDACIGASERIMRSLSVAQLETPMGYCIGLHYINVCR